MRPKIERIVIPADEIPVALHRLFSRRELPDGSEVVDRGAFRVYRSQIERGYFVRLTWAGCGDIDEIRAWLDDAAFAVECHKLGLI